jgi:stage II sporulation protein D
MNPSHRYGRRSFCRASLALAASLALSQTGCSQNAGHNAVPQGTPTIRVLLLENQKEVELSATATPTVHVGSDSAGQQLRFSPGVSAPILLSPAGWKVGSAQLPRGELTIEQSTDGSVYVAKHAYHGRFRFVPAGSDRFDVVNDLNTESYLCGVLRSELFADWRDETYKAQAIVARTYALYEARTDGVGRHFDVYTDQRSQVYGGIDAETDRSRRATAETAGIVVAYGPPGRETIFKSYFSSCCGGAGQSAADAFGDPDTPALAAQNHGACCIHSPKFNWGPITIPKAELTRRVRAWGAFKKQPIKDMAPLMRIEIAALNQFGRPVRFVITDAKGAHYVLRSEQMREAVNTEAAAGPKIFSSFCKPLDEGANIRFADGHGYGHGVGMCQWCAQSQAANGYNDEAIVLGAFPGARLVRAY